MHVVVDNVTVITIEPLKKKGVNRYGNGNEIKWAAIKSPGTVGGGGMAMLLAQ